MKCMSQDCDQEAKWQLGWTVKTPNGVLKPGMQVSGYLALGVCNDHKDCDIVHLINDETRAKVDGGLVLRGRLPANWKLAQCMRAPLIGDQFYLPSNNRPAGQRLAS